MGTPALTLFGLVGAALTVSLNRGGLLLSLLVVPTAIPTLIFGVAVAKAAAEGRDFAMPLTVLCGTHSSRWRFRPSRPPLRFVKRGDE